MRQASAVTGVSFYDLQTAKAAGCPAFRSSRVYGAELMAWLAGPDGFEQQPKKGRA